MAQRRDRPPVESAGDSINIRLPDGRTVAVPVRATRTAGTPGACCFCGTEVEDAGAERLALEVRWLQEGSEHSQNLSAHRACLLARLHESVQRDGPLFAG